MYRRFIELVRTNDTVATAVFVAGNALVVWLAFG